MSSKATILLFVLYITGIQGNQFRKDYVFYNQANAWFKLHRLPLDWHTARLQCYYEGAVLASPLNPDFLSTLKEMMSHSKLDVIFTGVHATHGGGVYTSVDGIPLEKMSIQWKEGPNNYATHQECTALLNDGFTDKDCKDYAPYICYRQTTATDELGACGTVDQEYSLDARTGHCYKFHDQPETWPRAYAICQAEGGHLAVVNSESEAALMKNLFNIHPPQYTSYKNDAFIGFRKWGPSDSWWTIHGEMLKYTGYERWGAEQPNNLPRIEKGFYTQACGSIGDDGGLNDMWCEKPLAFICEKTKNSLLNFTSDAY